MNLNKVNYNPRKEQVIYGALSLSCVGVNYEESKELHNFCSDSKYMNCVSFANKSDLCATGDIDGVVKIINLENNAPVVKTKFEDHGLAVRDLTFSKDDSKILTVGDDHHSNLNDVSSESRI
mmetsp:Transcript_11616/g.13134  ORF Transcript_11616/g.13134 Transcript_11616/m.13134 type:complete len:122 (-) Transcript_11616:265-630(-)